MGLRSCRPREWLGGEVLSAEPECSCGLIGAPFDFHHPECDRSLHPGIDEEALDLVEEVVESLVCLGGSGLGDAGTVLWALASLIAGAVVRVPGALADARDQDYTWAEIATRLAVSASAARRRYGHYARWRAERAGLGD